MLDDIYKDVSDRFLGQVRSWLEQHPPSIPFSAGQKTTMPGYEYSHVEFTSDVSITATASGSANTVVTAGAVTFDGLTPVLVEFFCSKASIGTTTVTFWFYQDGSELGRLSQQTASGPIRLTRRLTPAAGSHTYSIRGTVDAGTGTAAAGAGAAGNVVPGFIRITRCQ